MVIGALIGFILAILGYNSVINPNAGRTSVFFIGMAVFFGAVLGRILSSRWANSRIRKITALLYQQGRPQEFVDRFSPIVKKTPDNVVEYVDGSVKLAYAYEAMGEFEKGLSVLKAVDTEKLKLHKLAGTSLLENQKLKLYLLMEDIEKAEEQLERVKELQETATGRAATLAKNLQECVKLGDNWLKCLKGEVGDSAYIKEEVDLSGNRIHKSEMLVLLSRMKRLEGDNDEAMEYLKEAVSVGKDLYGGREAERLLAQLS